MHGESHMPHTVGWWAVVHISWEPHRHKHVGGKEIPAFSALQPDNSAVKPQMVRSCKVQVLCQQPNHKQSERTTWLLAFSADYVEICIFIYITCIGCTSTLSACLWEMLNRSCISLTSPNQGNLILTVGKREQPKVPDFGVCGCQLFTSLLTLLLPGIKPKPHLTSQRLQFASKVLPKPLL